MFLAAIILFFLIDPADAIAASKEGLVLWFDQILPTLLPFAVISSFLTASNLFEKLQEKAFFQKFRHILPAEFFAIVCGFLFGFPIGSKLSADMCRKGTLSRKRAQIICCFANNFSPVFVSGYVLTNQLRCPTLMVPTLLILYGPPLVFGIVRLFRATPEAFVSHKKPASRFQLDMQIIDAGIISGFETLIKLCGYIMFFSIGVHMLNKIYFLPDILRILLIGFTEITNGIAALAQSAMNDNIRYILAVMFLSFGGISGLAQTGSMIRAAGLSLRKYLASKMFFTGISTLLAIIFLLFF